MFNVRMLYTLVLSKIQKSGETQEWRKGGNLNHIHILLFSSFVSFFNILVQYIDLWIIYLIWMTQAYVSWGSDSISLT